MSPTQATELENTVTAGEFAHTNEVVVYSKPAKEKRKAGNKGKGKQVKRLKDDHEDHSIAPSYYFKDGLRFVAPYSYTFQVYCKRRWLGDTVFDVLSREFRDRRPEYYHNAIETGLITINRMKVLPTYVMNDSDLIEHVVHNIVEPPVTDTKIEIVYRDDNLLVLNKPGSIPIHPTGRYRHNSVVQILKWEFGFEALFPVNRIDRLTSGLCIMGLNKNCASHLSKEMSDRMIQKTYLARCKGDFPEDVIECNEPIATASHKAGINLVRADGKECKTTFKKISFNGRTSLVECVPKTGRTHQIRVHLQYLGFPIANDPLYCTDAWPNWGKGGIDASQEFDVVNKVMDKVYAHETPEEVQLNKERTPPVPEQLQIWLHSFAYSNETDGEGWNYKTTKPAWADDDFDDSIVEEKLWKYGGIWFDKPLL
jgi:RluA family pseudouridine synthase